MEMTPKKRAILCITGNRRRADRISACDPLTTATVEQMMAVKAPFPDAHRDPELHARLAAAAWEIIGLEGFKVPFDLCVEAEALGATIDYGSLDRHPSVRKPAFEDLKDLKIPEKVTE
ncbi:MAG: methylcobamide--CoM methyltransferase, partial [Thermoprotei archaeon]